MNSLPAHPDALRLLVFVAVFAVMALLELRWPRRPLTVAKRVRWPINLMIVVAGAMATRLVFPLAPFAFAAWIEANGIGLFNLVGWRGPAELVTSLVLLDLLIYTQHRLFHRLPLCWRLHRMHHTDLDLDVTSGARFHPIEIVLSMAIKLSAVAVLGISPLAALLFEIILNAAAMFNHANLRLPLALDRWLRLLVVTPDMHRVHHSVIGRETDSNFGFNQPWWDRLFGTYRAQPQNGHDAMEIGLRQWRDQDRLGLWDLLVIPFVRKPPGASP